MSDSSMVRESTGNIPCTRRCAEEEVMLGLLRLINQNCRGAARLLSDQKERPLSPLERGGLRIHLLGCRSCRHYREQINAVDQFLSQPQLQQDDAQSTLSVAARKRILQALSESP